MQTQYIKDANPHINDFHHLPIALEHDIVYAKSYHEQLLHWHDEVEIIRVNKGHIHCHVNESDFLLSPGELCFINVDQMHKIYNSSSEDCDIDVISIKAEMLAKNEEVYEKFIKPIIHNKEFSHVEMAGKNSYALLISSMINDIYAMIEEKPYAYELDIIGYVYMIFRRLYLVYITKKEEAPYSTDTSLQRRMSTYIYEHYGEKITLDDIASAANVSRSKCASLFKKYTQSTPIAFLNSYRLEMASRMLARGEESLADIAVICGFGEQSYFSRLFTKEYGCTPLTYRKEKQLL